MSKTKFAVKVHNEFLSEAIQELAFANGYEKWENIDLARDSTKVYKYLTFSQMQVRFSNDDKIGLLYDTLYDAKTDWDAIEQAMKSKEPRVIWVSFNSSGEIFDAKKQNGLLHGVPPNGSIVKFQEVIE